MKLFAILLVVSTVLASLVKGQDFYGEIEAGCANIGGSCILEQECEVGNQASKPNLCPKQQGYECCHGYPKSEYRCKKFGGECFKKGQCRTPFARAKDCGAEEDCCILI